MTYRAQIFVVHPNPAKRTEIAGMLIKMIKKGSDSLPDVDSWDKFTNAIGCEVVIGQHGADFINWFNSGVVHPAFKKVIPDPRVNSKAKGKPDFVDSGRRGRNVDNTPPGKRKRLLSDIRPFIFATHVPVDYGGQQYRDQVNRLGLKPQ